MTSHRLLIHWERFGPYHLARLRAAKTYLEPYGFDVIGLETASEDQVYAWRKEEQRNDLSSYVILPGQTRERVSRWELWRKAWVMLNQIQPSIVYLAGFSTIDVHAMLAWCRFNKRPAVLMSDSKFDDRVRTIWKETLKRWLVRQYQSALCGGTPHQQYLEQLGMPVNRIALGYDVVDNTYFEQMANHARAIPDDYRHLPGLADDTPFFLASSRFIARKNLDGLLHAYRTYCQTTTSPPWRLIILGDGEERPKLEAIISADENLQQNVTLAGFQQIDAIPAYYGFASVFIHPALQEQWGLVVNEAMAAGVPVLVSNVCGCVPNLIDDGDNGLLFDPTDVPQLAEKMLEIANGQYALATIAMCGQSRIADWGLERFASGVYEALRATEIEF